MQEGVRCSNGGLCNGGLSPCRGPACAPYALGRCCDTGAGWRDVHGKGVRFSRLPACGMPSCIAGKLSRSVGSTSWFGVVLWHSLLLSHLHGGLCRR
jgi:hypothetical protein